ncbi:MAG TPA: Hsp20/alpha crystallin family protein [Methylomirabilota bacterium]|nr:Hsp20/alpha crystallin family protein [Methylomirabilota bacterium]
MAAWAPLVDIVEDDKQYLIKAELPEVQKEDVKVRVEDGILYLSGERRLEKDKKGRRYHRVERVYGSFTRSFVLPEAVDSKHVSAEFKDGALNVRLTKNPDAGPKSVEIKVT